MAHDAIFVKESAQPDIGTARETLAPAYLRDPVEPFGYGHGRDQDNPNVGKWRFIKSYQPAGLLVVPNEADSPAATHAQFTWENQAGVDGLFLGTRKQGETDGTARRRKRS